MALAPYSTLPLWSLASCSTTARPLSLTLRGVTLAIACAGLTLTLGCASTDDNLMGSGTGVTATDRDRLTNSGFLSDYGRLKPAPWGDGIECWRSPQANLKKYNKVLITRMEVTLKPEQQKGIDPTDLKTLTDYFHAALVRELKPQMAIVDKPGPDVIVIRIALTDLVPTSVGRSVTGTLIPYGFVAEAGSGAATGRPAGSPPIWVRRAWRCSSWMAVHGPSSPNAATRRSDASTRPTSTRG